MKTKKENVYEIIRTIESPYRNIGEQIKYDTGMEKMFKKTKDIEKYNLEKMFPIVTYDDWIVCQYAEDNKLYYLDAEEIVEVAPCKIAVFDNKYDTAVAEDGKILTALDDFYMYGGGCLCCGMTDDMKYYIGFDREV